ncbi:4-alpha-glucanotransferase [Streptosporangium sandarakinum]|uniref:4-alpha-glucanotransferase n=1 Tax=Streptosporangium sandarakinum TaxID=1260955 RepID=A0A852V0B1_9ACTN|nr:4-alpha-glucanotransferase [Streptosporangium sandarakinum]NYF41929.1 4-alpha-glucanotransferase [Streptosporangium sandarakinum]
MADAWGIEHEYEDAGGRRHRVSPETVAALREAMGAPPYDAGTDGSYGGADAGADRSRGDTDGRAGADGGDGGDGGGGPRTLVRRRGDRVGPAELVLEDGSELRVDDVLPPDLPFGYHTLRRPGEETGHRLIVSPGRCHPPERRAWGWAAQLYAARSRESWGVGDLADLRRLARWASGQCGAGFLLLNPLHATAPVPPVQPSPYFPASRRFHSPLYLRVEEVPGAAESGADLRDLAARGRALNERRHIDRDEAWRLKLAALEAIWRRTPPGEEFDAWRARRGDGLAEFAAWCALTERHGPNWQVWPVEYRRPDGPAVARFAREHADRVRFHAWLQWLTDRQLAAAASGVQIIQDLPVGVDPDGADAWSWQDLLAQGVSVGAPADEFNTAGQDWGLPPFVPWKLRRAGYRPFADSVRATIASAGGLRIDHVMGLFRLWWIPSGAGAGQGAYVRYPAGDLLDIVALESHRAGAVVVGEDLGTVEPGVRETLADRRMLSYRLLWFEEDDPARWPERALAAVTTHDLPTVAGLWDGSDLAAQRRLGLDPNEDGSKELRRRLAEAGDLDAGADADAAVLAAYRLLARAPSLLLSATLDDALAEPERPNIPGADGERANWCLALPVPLEELENRPLARRLAETLSGAVTAAGEPVAGPGTGIEAGPGAGTEAGPDAAPDRRASRRSRRGERGETPPERPAVSWT